MAITSLTTGGTSAAFPADYSLKGTGVVTFVFNIASAITARGGGATTLTTGDIYNCIRVPPGWVVLNVVVTPTSQVTAGTAKMKIDVGYTAQNTAWGSGVDLTNNTQVGQIANLTLMQSAKAAKLWAVTGGVSPVAPAQTIDVKIHSSSGTAVTGTVRLDALIFDATSNTTG